MLALTRTPSWDIPKVLGEWRSPTNRATSRPSQPGLSSSSTGRSTRGWRWSPTCWTTSCVTSVRAAGVAASLLLSSAQTWLVFRWENFLVLTPRAHTWGIKRSRKQTQLNILLTHPGARSLNPTKWHISFTTREMTPPSPPGLWWLSTDVLPVQYYCEQCWSSIHSRPGREFHKPLVKEGADRPRAVPFRWC